MTDNEIIASKMPARNRFGQDGSPMPSSLTPGQTKSPIADVNPLMVDVPGLDAQDQLSHRVGTDGDGKVSEIAPCSAMRHRSSSDGSPGGMFGNGNNHRDSGKALSPSTFGRPQTPRT